jgi:DNA repair protein RadA/Sms
VVGALASSMIDRALPTELIAIGEVGLTGEVRSVSQVRARLQEAARLGFTRAVVPKGAAGQAAAAGIGEVSGVETLEEAWAAMLG